MRSENLGPAIAVGAVAALAVYRRLRRTIGRQPLNPGRLSLRIALLALVCVIATTLRPLPHEAPAAIAAGAIAGIALALFALRHTGFEFTPAGNFYTPHLYIGLAVAALLVARLLYRVVQLSSVGAAAGAEGPVPMFGSPLTLGILFVTAGYYAAYNTGLLLRVHRHTRGMLQSTPDA